MYYNIYFSPTGGTKRVAVIIASNLCDEYCDVDWSFGNFYSTIALHESSLEKIRT